MRNEVGDSELPRFNSFVAGAMGLTFPTSRWPDLRRGIARTAKELGFDDDVECAQWFMSGKSTANAREVLASHLTVGETYFFREKRSFEILANHIIPRIIQSCGNRQPRLRIWSAACCTGEEPYSIAIALRQAIPDLKEWNITLLASDINSRFLEKARTGVYGEWSFRNAPVGLKERYFRRNKNGQFEILPDIKAMVRFTSLNLADDVYPSLENGVNDMDVIFCRNVLMYFTEEQSAKTIDKLHQTQANGGWLIVGPSELLNASSGAFTAAKIDGTTVYQRNDEQNRQSQSKRPIVVRFSSEIIDKFQFENPAPVAAAKAEAEPVVPLNQLALVFANQGKWSEALDCCDRWIEVDRLNASGYCLRAAILREKGEVDDAVLSLRTSLYLDPNCIAAHFAMGNIAQSRGHIAHAVRHLINARTLLHRHKSGDVLPELDGITAGRLIQIVTSLIERSAAA